jgi:four helix bundle protein
METESHITDYRDLDVWKVSMDLAVDIYGATRTFPRDEMFGMTSQLRRAATSVPANIAEGFGREQTGGFVQFLRVAQGSLKELETHILLSQRVGLLDEQISTSLGERCGRVGKMLRGLIRSLQSKKERR